MKRSVFLAMLALIAPLVAAQQQDDTTRERLADGEFGYEFEPTGTVMLYRFDVFRSPDSLVTIEIVATDMIPGPSASLGTAAALPEVGGEPFVVPLTTLRQLVENLDRYASVPGPGAPQRTQLEINAEGDVTMGIQRTIGWPIAVLLVLLVLALAGVTVLYGRARRDRRGRLVLVEARKAAIASREAERLRIARDLHDGPVQQLHGLRLRMRPGFAPDRPEGADEAGEEIQSVVDEVRAIAENLRPPALGPFGLAAALEALGAKVAMQHPHVTVIVDVERQEGYAQGDEPEDVQLALYRVAQEAMNNAVEHAEPSILILRYRSKPAPALEITNDGSAFEWPSDLGALRAQGRFGLVGIAERIELIGGRLHVLSRPGGGIRLRVTL